MTDKKKKETKKGKELSELEKAEAVIRKKKQEDLENFQRELISLCNKYNVEIKADIVAFNV